MSRMDEVVAHTSKVRMRISRARAALAAQLPTAVELVRERIILDVDGRVVVYRYDDRLASFVLEGEVVRVDAELARWVAKHRSSPLD